MDFDAFASLLMAGGYAMFAHLVLSLVLRKLLQWNSPLSLELFAVPNAPFAPDIGFRLLRGRYYLLWRPAPSDMAGQPMLAKALFFLTRVTGAAVPVCLLSFLGGMVYLGTR